MAKILFVHNTFPGRFQFLLDPLLAAGHQCKAIASAGRTVAGVPLHTWKTNRGQSPNIFDLAVRAEIDFLRGRAAADCALQLKKEGFTPDLIIGHPSWGETLFMKEVFPDARMILCGEFYYRTRGADTNFDMEFNPTTIEERFKIHAKNAAMAMAFVDADRIIFPTEFQASVFPAALRERGIVIHEGIESERVRRLPGTTLKIGDGRTIDGAKPVVTFINRTFEPLRGFHIVMRALPALLEAVPDVTVLMIGSDGQRGYGKATPDGSTWRAHMARELGRKIDPNRVLFTGKVPHETMIGALSISWAHVYYTYPFVLSWSLVEAMACECLIVGSDTPPLRDAIVNGRNGILHDFFDVGALSKTLIEVCRNPAPYAAMRKAARQTVVERFDQKNVCLPAWLKEIDALL